jgi:hypothetical protein
MRMPGDILEFVLENVAGRAGRSVVLERQPQLIFPRLGRSLLEHGQDETCRVGW